MATDPAISAQRAESLGWGVIGVEAVTDGAGATFTQTTKGIYIGTAGDIHLTFADGSAEVLPDHPAGPFRYCVTAVGDSDAGTTAEGVLGMF